MTSELPELFQMRYSMFPEMARWALDWKGIPHIRQSVLPGPHAPKLQKIAGQTCMPVLRYNNEVIKDSDNILDFIEAQWPEKPLYPSDPVDRQQAIEIRDRFRQIGPDVRRAFFYALLPASDYAASLFSRGQTADAQRQYARFFWGVKLIMKASMKISRRRAEASVEVTQEALDWLADNVNEKGFLVGDQFSVADLTAATVMCCTCLSEGTNAYAEEPRPDGLQDWVDRWADHPAVGWSQHIYAKYRPASAAVEDRNY